MVKEDCLENFRAFLRWRLSPDDFSPHAVRYEAQQNPGEWQILPGDQFGRNLGIQISGDAVPETSTFLLIAPTLAIFVLGSRISPRMKKRLGARHR